MFTYVLCTLFDITATDVVFYNRQQNTLTQRNQQRNWQVISHLIQLRTQPVYISTPVCRTVDVKNLHFGPKYHGQHRVWVSWWTVETPEIYGTEQNPLSVLLADFDQIPMLVNLEESAEFYMPMLMTQNQDCNICFYTQQQWINNEFELNFDIINAK
jgi:hypothetical protein